MEKKISIAIDGFSACGKSSTAKALAKRLGYIYIDTGAMYRAVTLYFIEHKVDIDSPEDVRKALEDIQIEFRKVPEHNFPVTFLNGENVEHTIRLLEVSNHVSDVSAITAVRRKLVQMQREMGKAKGVVMDGRDIGTVVFPDAELKIFMTANANIRAHRRQIELERHGKFESTENVRKNLIERDRIDSTRDDSPLRQADDATLLDTSDLDFAEQVEIIYHLAMEEIKGK